MQQLNKPNGNCKFEERQPWKQWPFSGLQTVISVKVVCDITFVVYLLCCRDWKVKSESGLIHVDTSQLVLLVPTRQQISQ